MASGSKEMPESIIVRESKFENIKLLNRPEMSDMPKENTNIFCRIMTAEEFKRVIDIAANYIADLDEIRKEVQNEKT